VDVLPLKSHLIFLRLCYKCHDVGRSVFPWVDHCLTPTIPGRNTAHRLILMNGRKSLVIIPGRGLTSASAYSIPHGHSFPLISVISGIFASSRNTTQTRAFHTPILSFAVPMGQLRLDTIRTSGLAAQALYGRA
jgi:hypothetical protein